MIRLLRGVLRVPTCWVPMALGVLAMVVLGVLAHDARGTRVLGGPLSCVLVVLLATASARASTPKASGDAHTVIESLVDAGLPAHRALYTYLGAQALLQMLAFTLGVGLLLVCAYSPGDAPLGRDLVHTAPILFTTAIAYASYYTAAGTFWRGRGTALAMLLDLLLLAPDSTSLPTPSSHANALLGAAGQAPLTHFFALWTIAAIATLIAWLRVRRRAYPPEVRSALS